MTIFTEFHAPDTSKTVREILFDSGFAVTSPCGGNGTCGKCRLRVSGKLTPPDETERRLLGDDLGRGFRITCRTRPAGDFSVDTEGIAFNNMKIATEINVAPEDFSPVVEIPSGEKGYGSAVDLGTTTAALYIVDLTDGRIIFKSGFPNPQSRFGADVISRISYISQNSEGLEKLRGLILRSIEDEILRSGVDAASVRYITVAGNTVMQHIFCGLDPSSIAVAPFTPKSLFGETFGCAFEKLDCPVFMMPCAASYVGGDILSGLCSSGVDTAEELTLFLDIGTNGELALGSRDKITTCACAAGPAFEGANLSCGMPGVEGAICSITAIDGGKVDYRTIGDKPARGICGSAVIDHTAKLLDAGIIDDSGFMEENFKLTPDGSVSLSPKDVREIQLAKAAVSAAVLTLLERAGKTAGDIASVRLAGGFGSFLDKDSACRIGLFPGIPAEKITTVGNASGAGAVGYLVSRGFRERLERLAREISYIELSGDKFFMEQYVEQMFFDI